MHIGDVNPGCLTLFVNHKKHGQEMKKVKEDTYLGTVISDSCDNDKKL